MIGQRMLSSGSERPGRASAFALAEIPLPWLSKVVIIDYTWRYFSCPCWCNKWPVYALPWAADWSASTDVEQLMALSPGYDLAPSSGSDLAPFPSYDLAPSPGSDQAPSSGSGTLPKFRPGTKTE